MSAITLMPPLPRLRHIRTVVRLAQTLIILALLAMGATLLLVLACGLELIHLPIESWQPVTGVKYDSIASIPRPVVGLLLVQTALFFAGGALLHRVLGAFARGDFFCAANIRRGHWLGVLLLANWLLNKLVAAVAAGELSLVLNDLTQLTLGLLIILLAWILDEGRKLQEEQALTI